MNGLGYKNEISQSHHKLPNRKSTICLRANIKFLCISEKNQIGNDRVKKFCRSKIVQQFGNDLKKLFVFLQAGNVA